MGRVGKKKKKNFIEHNTQLITIQVTGYQKAKAIYAGYPTKNKKEGVAEGEGKGRGDWGWERKEGELTRLFC